MAKRVTVIVGGQYGSEGKGAIAAWFHRRFRYDAGIRVGGPNAGHTVVDDAGIAFPLRQIPVAAAVDHNCQLVVAAGSEVDEAVLIDELHMLQAEGHVVADRLLVDEEATVIVENHKKNEAMLANGSTHKGIGAARAARALRKAPRVADVIGWPPGTFDFVGEFKWDPSASYLIEGTQGYGLGSHAGFYPHCTSGDCRAIDFLAQAGAPPWIPELEVWVVARTFPIRIAGNSGPLKNETTWAEVGVPPEFTTVTKKERRVGKWDGDLVAKAVEANGGKSIVKVALSFADYWWPELKGATAVGEVMPYVFEQLKAVEAEIGAEIRLLGTGPNTCVAI